MSKATRENEEVIEDFMNHTHLMNEYWADIKLQEIHSGTRLGLGET